MNKDTTGRKYYEMRKGCGRKIKRISKRMGKRSKKMGFNLRMKGVIGLNKY